MSLGQWTRVNSGRKTSCSWKQGEWIAVKGSEQQVSIHVLSLRHMPRDEYVTLCIFHGRLSNHGPSVPLSLSLSFQSTRPSA